MSYDLMVFKVEDAPKDRNDFIDWYRIQTSWQETHGYNDPANTAPELRNWFMEMVKSFPAMNGPFANNDIEKSSTQADYTIGKHMIYITFSWSLAESAYRLTRSLAQKYSI